MFAHFRTAPIAVPVTPQSHEKTRAVNEQPTLKLVRRGGLEPPRCYPLAPQASASANSATSAKDNAGYLPGALGAAGAGAGVEAGAPGAFCCCTGAPGVFCCCAGAGFA